MTRLRTIRKAFISYAREDSAFVERLAHDLRTKGIDVWVDFEGLEPGTPDWEATVRQAMEESFAVLFIASASSRRSIYVRGELLLAKEREVPIYALWAGGDTWIDSVPLDFAQMQYQDFRDGAYQDSFHLLLQYLTLRGPIIPPHFIFEEYYEKVPEGDRTHHRSLYLGGRAGAGVEFSVYKKCHLPRLIEIRLVNPMEALEHQSRADALFVNPGAFQSAARLLDELYVHYLADQYPPFTYGRRWHLERGWHPVHLAIDWRTLGDDVQENDVQLWAMDRSPDFYGFTPGSVWTLKQGLPDSLVTIAGYDKELIEIILRNPKASYMVNRYMRPGTVAELKDSSLENVAVISQIPYFKQGVDVKHQVFIQAADFPEEARRRWRY